MKQFEDLQISHKLTEHSLWTKIRPWFMSHGYAFRVDNVANTSPPDITFISEDHVFLIELKILHGNKITFQVGQIPIFHQIDIESSGKQPWIFGWDQRLEAIRVVPFSSVDLKQTITKNHALTFPMGCATECIVHNSQEFQEWLRNQ